jgi:uncharacterized membrane-anchored protein YhcB (DUF1043 family)
MRKKPEKWDDVIRQWQEEKELTIDGEDAWAKNYMPKGESDMSDDELGIPKLKKGGKSSPQNLAAHTIDQLNQYIRGMERDLERLYAQLNKYKDDIVKHKEEVAKLKNILAREQVTKKIMGKTIGELKVANDLLAADNTKLKAKCSTDHVLAVRKLPELQVKRHYKA